jgi:glutamine synthetase
MFSAGLSGIKEGTALPSPVEENIYKMSNSRQRKFEIGTLPRDLSEAVRIMEKSDLMKDILGEHIFSRFLANKRHEIEEYNRNVSREFDKQVSDYEIRKYLPFL